MTAGLIEYYKKSFHRIHLEKYLNEYAGFINGKILDIGSKNRRYDSLFAGNVTAIDIVPDESNNVIFGDVTDLKYDDESFDSVLALEILEYVRSDKIGVAFDEIIRILNKNGTCLIGIPFICSDHKDRVRLTSSHLQEMLLERGVTDVKVHKIGNGYAACWDIIRGKIMSIQNTFIRRGLLIPAVVLFRAIMKVFNLDSKVDGYYLGVLLVISK